MLAKTINPYLQFLRSKYPMFKITERVPSGLKPGDIERVIYENDMVEIVFKFHGAMNLAVMNASDGQRLIMNLKREIAKRSEYLERVEDWECRNEHGLFDMGMQFRLIDSRMNEAEIEFMENALSVNTNTERLTEN